MKTTSSVLLRYLLLFVPAGAGVVTQLDVLGRNILPALIAVVLSLAPKSAKTPIAMGISEQIGGQPSLTAVFVLMTGIAAIVLYGPVMRLFFRM